MDNDRVELARSWAQKNEPFFRLAELLVIVVCGGFLTAYVSWQQYKLANIQVKVAQAQLQPNFEVSEWMVFQPVERDIAATQVYPHRSDIRNLESGPPALFLEQLDEHGTPRRVVIDGFFLSIPESEWPADFRAPRNAARRVLHFTTSCRAFGFADTKFLCDPQSVSKEEFQNAWTNPRRRAFCFVRIQYMNAIHDKVVECFTIEYPRLTLRRVNDEPRYDYRIRTEDFMQPDGEPDFTKIVSTVNSLFLE